MIFTDSSRFEKLKDSTRLSDEIRCLRDAQVSASVVGNRDVHPPTHQRFVTW